MSAPPQNPPVQSPAPGVHAAGPGDLTKPPQNVDQIKARISSKQTGAAWHQPLFNPFADPVRCLLGYFCGPCMYGMNQAAIEGTDDWIVPCLIFYFSGAFCLQWFIGAPTRSKIRQKYGLEEAPYSDCITYTGLCCFAVCQESAELEYQKKQGNPPSGPSKVAAPAPTGGAMPPPPPAQAPPAQHM